MSRFSSEQDLLDQIEDAEEAVARYRRVLRLLLTIAGAAASVFVAGITVGVSSVGSGVDWGFIAAALIIPSALALLGAGGAAWWWFYMQNTRAHHYTDNGFNRPWTGGPVEELRKARRAHRNWLMERAS